MGINGLWQVLEPAARAVPIISLALQDRYVGPGPHSPYVVGIDASAWFEQCQQGRWHRARAQTGQNPALRTFLFRLARLARHPVQLVFCYDGNQRPQVKRGHRVSTSDHWMVKPTQRILNAFNVQWLTAMGEAEAQLALMNSAGIIDAVMTDDSDAFVFGARTVFRNSTFSTGSESTVSVYTTSAIQERVDRRLIGNAFLTFAVCAGGDYDTKGLLGCGRETALGLACCMNAGMLRHAVDDNSQLRSLQCWRHTARYHLMNDPTGEMGRSHPALARSLPDSFPDPLIVNLYAHPAVTPLAELPALRPPRPPNVALLASLIQQLLGWDSKKVVGAFRTAVWPVVVLHELLEDLANISPESDEVDLAFGRTRMVFNNHPRRRKQVLAGVSGHRNDVPMHNLERTTLQLLMESPGSSRDRDMTPECCYIRVWLADQIYDRWVQTMFPPSLSPAPVSPATLPSSTSVIDLTQDEDAAAAGTVIDLTGDNSDGGFTS